MVADGLADDAFDITNVGEHLDAATFNQKIAEGATVVDMRNNYECMIGHFEGALSAQERHLPWSGRGGKRTAWERVRMCKGEKEASRWSCCTAQVASVAKRPVLFRSITASHNVGQLHGGIIDYARQIKAERSAQQVQRPELRVR